MARLLRRAGPVIVVALLVGAIALLLTTRPDLGRAHDAVAERWRALRPALVERYSLLAAANDAVRTVGGADRGVVTDTDAALARWRDVTEGETEAAARDDSEIAPAGDVGAQVRAANDLEGLARRLAATVAQTPRLDSDEAVNEALTAFAEAPVPDTVRAFGTAVADYEDERGGPFRRVVANVLGYDEIPALDL